MNGDGILNALVRGYYDFQRARIAFGNRISALERGVSGPREDKAYKGSILEVLADRMEMLKEAEDDTEKMIAKEIQRYPIWTEWLAQVKGAGPVLSAVIITTFDIEVATTVSKLWQFAGLNPGMVRGWKSDGTDPKTNRPRWKLTEELIRGDRLTAGFRAPFNKWLRTQLCGKLGPSFLKAGGDYALQYYYPQHVPKARRDEMGPGRLDVEEGWKDKREGHRSRAAIRYMVKMFLADLYVQWRQLEGLPVRPPYTEEYLGHAHSA